MKINIFSLRNLDYLRIILFIPVAWVAYNLSANIVAELSSKDFIMRIGVNTWRYGFDVLQFFVFVIAGVLVAPAIVRLWSGILSFLNYVILTVWSIWTLPSAIDITRENIESHRLMSYSVMILIMLLSIAIVVIKYHKAISCTKNSLEKGA